jgi:hypothetical protein
MAQGKAIEKFFLKLRRGGGKIVAIFGVCHLHFCGGFAETASSARIQTHAQ